MKHTQLFRPDPQLRLELVNPNDQEHEIRITFNPDTQTWLVRSYGVVKSIEEGDEATILDAVEAEVDPDWPVTRISMPCMRLEIDRRGGRAS